MQTITRTKRIYIGKKRGAKSKGIHAREKTCPFKVSHLQFEQYYALSDPDLRAWVCDEPYRVFSQRLATAVEKSKAMPRLMSEEENKKNSEAAAAMMAAANEYFNSAKSK
jgi:hypothetical protein